MRKSLKLLSITSLATPLVLLSCSQAAAPQESKIIINRTEMVKNFTTADSGKSFTLESINNFVQSFNEAPSKYFISATPVTGITQFIQGDVSTFLTIKDTTKINFIAEVVNNAELPSFSTVKFNYKLKPEFKSSLEVDASTIDKLIFSMQFRVLVPDSSSANVNFEKEKTWISVFTNRINFKNPTFEFLKNTPQEIIALIGSDKAVFEQNFIFIVPFPQELITKWNYSFEIVSTKEKEIVVNFTLTNTLFPSITVVNSATFFGFA